MSCNCIFSRFSIFPAATLFCALQESTPAHFPPLFNQKSWSVIFLSIRQRHSLVMSAPAVVQSNAIFPLSPPSDQTDFPVFDWITPHFSWNQWYLKMLSIWIILYILPLGRCIFLKDPLLNISNTQPSKSVCEPIPDICYLFYTHQFQMKYRSVITWVLKVHPCVISCNHVHD